MKKVIISIVSLISFLTVSAQINTIYFEAKDAFKTFPVLKQANVDSKNIVLKEIDKKNIQQLLEEDKSLERIDVPFQFGYGIDVDYSLKDGKWINENSKRIWSLRITSKGAYSLNFIFSEMQLSPKAELYIFNPDGWYMVQ